jgi:Protein of unknown function (DUF2510)
MDEHPLAGWYPDPSDPSAQRWWDGTRWSAEYVRPAAHVAAADVAAPLTPGPSGHRGLIVALVAAGCVIALLIATSIGFIVARGNGTSAAVRASTPPVASSTPAESAPTVVSSTPAVSADSPPPSTTSRAKGTQAKAGHVSLVLPQGWIKVPTKPGDLKKFVDHVSSQNPAFRPYYNAVRGQLKRQGIAFLAIGPLDLKEKFVDTAIALAVPSQGADLSEIAAGASATLSSVGATDVSETRTTLGGSDTLRITVKLRIHRTPTTALTIREAAYYIDRDGWIYSLTVALGVNQPVASADRIAKTFRIH